MVFAVMFAPLVALAMFIVMFFCASVPLGIMLQWALKNPVKGFVAGMAMIGVLLLLLALVVAQYPPNKQTHALVLWSLYCPAILSGLLGWVMVFRREYGKAFLLWTVGWIGGGMITPWIEVLGS